MSPAQHGRGRILLTVEIYECLPHVEKAAATQFSNFVDKATRVKCSGLTEYSADISASHNDWHILISIFLLGCERNSEK